MYIKTEKSKQTHPPLSFKLKLVLISTYIHITYMNHNEF